MSNSIQEKNKNNLPMVELPKKLTIEGREKILFFVGNGELFGDKKELMEMAGIDEELLAHFFDEKETD